MHPSSPATPETAAPDADGRVPLIAVGAWFPGSGFTRVLTSVLSRLTDAYAIHYIGMGYKGLIRQVDGITLHPSNLRGGDVFGAAQAGAMIEALDARLVLLLNDLWMLRTYMRVLPRYRDRVKVVAYFPLDGRLPDDALVAPLTAIDRFVAYTQFGQAEIGAALARLRAQGADIRSTEVAVIPHGVDTATFHPLAPTIARQIADGGRRAVRQHLFPDEPDWQDAFIVLNANRPMERKRIDLTIAGFAQFARGKPANVKLWLHHAIMNADEHAAILAQAARHGVADRLRLSPLGAPPLSDTALNCVYNACEVGLNTAMGEGWGLVSFEHAATGAAQVVPRHSACAELWEGAAALVETEDIGVPRCSLLAMRTVAPGGVAAALERLYVDREYRCRMSLAAWRNATQPAYRWERIAAQWRQVFADSD
jgi:glycosyltransferase involved in cell wall biosynthesis